MEFWQFLCLFHLTVQNRSYISLKYNYQVDWDLALSVLIENPMRFSWEISFTFLFCLISASLDQVDSLKNEIVSISIFPTLNIKYFSKAYHLFLTFLV